MAKNPEPGTRPSQAASRPVSSALELVTSRAQHSKNYHGAYFRRLARWYDMYRGIWRHRFAQFRNNIHIPFTFSVIQSDVARKAQATFGAFPTVEFVGTAPEDVDLARQNDILVSSQFRDASMFEKAVDLYLMADLYGTAIAKVGWKTVIRHEKLRVKDELMNREEVVDADIVRFDGPCVDVRDPANFWPQPGKRRIPEMDWVIDRSIDDYDNLVEMAEQGVYDIAAVKRLKDRTSHGPQQESTSEWPRLTPYRSFQDSDEAFKEKHSKPVEIWEMWGLVPPEHAPDGVRMRVITVANQSEVIRNEPSPFWHGQLPFIAYAPQPDPHYFHGTGKAETLEKMQLTANRLANQKLDAIDLLIDPVFLMSRSSGIDTENLYMRAGRVIGIDGPVGDDTIRPVTPDMRGVQQSYAEIQQLWSWMQQGSGIVEDVVQGGAGGRQTAREFLGRQEAVMSRLMMEARLAEETFVEPLADMFLALDRQFLELPHRVRILGSNATTNPITGMPMPTQEVVIDLDNLNTDYRSRAVGSTQQMGKTVRQQNLIALLQALSSNPVMLQQINWGAFARQLFETFDVKNVNELILTQLSPINQMATQQQGTGQAPGGGGGFGETSLQEGLPQLDMNMLGAQGNGALSRLGNVGT